MFNLLGRSTYEQDAAKLRPLVMERARLTGDVSAGATTIQVNNLPRNAGAYSGWVVIDHYTTECEVRLITARAGKGLTVAALTYAHHKFDEVLFLDWPVLSAKWFGALGDNSTDDTTALSRALTAVGGIAGRLVISAGTYLVTSTLTQPRRTIVEGQGSTIDNTWATLIKAKTGWSGTNLWVMGDSTSAFGTQLLNICIDGAGLVNTGIFSDQIEENSGCRFVRVRETTQYGWKFINGGASSGKNPRNFFLEQLYYTVSSTVTSGDEIGLYVDGNNDVSGYNYFRGVDGMTVDITPNGGTNGLCGVRLLNCRGSFISRLHVEGASYGLEFYED